MSKDGAEELEWWVRNGGGFSVLDEVESEKRGRAGSGVAERFEGLSEYDTEGTGTGLRCGREDGSEDMLAGELQLVMEMEMEMYNSGGDVRRAVSFVGLSLANGLLRKAFVAEHIRTSCFERRDS